MRKSSGTMSKIVRKIKEVFGTMSQAVWKMTGVFGTRSGTVRKMKVKLVSYLVL